MPIAVAATAALAANAALLALYAAAPVPTLRALNGLLLVVGLLAFAGAMRFDLADPRRETRRADIAFWLHLLAAPLIVHSVFQGLGLVRPQVEPLSAVTILAVFGLLGIVALLVDRRAMLVSGLAYAGIAFSSLVRQIGAGVGIVAPVTLLILGALVLLLSAGWHPLRSRLLALLSPGLAARLPQPSPTP